MLVEPCGQTQTDKNEPKKMEKIAFVDLGGHRPSTIGIVELTWKKICVCRSRRPQSLAAKPCQAERSRAKLSRAEPSWAGLTRAEPSRAEPRQDKLTCWLRMLAGIIGWLAGVTGIKKRWRCATSWHVGRSHIHLKVVGSPMPRQSFWRGECFPVSGRNGGEDSVVGKSGA